MIINYKNVIMLQTQKLVHFMNASVYKMNMCYVQKIVKIFYH